MEELISLVNRLQAIFSATGSDAIKFPMIVVVGSQSSGKSSVLESFVGRDFLPRGKGIVTRRPLILQMHHLDDRNAPEHARFLHLPDTPFTDYSSIRREIVAETDRVTGGGRNISPEPITLQLFSPHVLDLTVVDLPGIVRNAVDGQDPGIVEQIASVVREYTSNPNALILAVSPATEDLANSEALLAARQADPQRERTIGVITKLDLMDAGTDARAILENSVSPLRLGYIGVVNRGQADLDDRLPLSEARGRERAFFAASPAYSHIADRCGSEYLARYLSSILTSHIRAALPAIRMTIHTRLAANRRELLSYGECPTEATRRTLALDAIMRYVDGYAALLNGEAGGRISLFFAGFGLALDAVAGPRALPPAEAYAALRRGCGLAVPMFTPIAPVTSIVGAAVERLREPSLALVRTVAATLEEIYAQVEVPATRRFPGFQAAVCAAAEECIRARIGPTWEMISVLIDCEKGLLSAEGTARPAGEPVNPRERPPPERPRTRTAAAVCTLFGTARAPTAAQEGEIAEVLAIAAARFETVREKIKDLVPKAIVKLLVRESEETLRQRLIEELLGDGEIAELLKEDPVTAKRRIACRMAIDQLTKAEELMDDVTKHW